jgi:SAM-dependent methyltransferase
MTTTSAAVVPEEYWEQRARRFAHAGWGLRAICSYGMPAFYNGYIHLIQRRALARRLRVPAGATVLDIGCGVGRWSRQLARTGTRVIGIDLAPAMVAEARRRAAAERVDDAVAFQVADVADLQLAQHFDWIVCVTVLQHILDAGRFQRAVVRMRDHLAPGGRLIVLEAAPSDRDSRCDTASFVARPESEYRLAFERGGLVCVETSGVDPLPLKTRFLPWYGRLPRPAAIAALFFLTALALPIDLVASPWLTRASWHKLFVLTRA